MTTTKIIFLVCALLGTGVTSFNIYSKTVSTDYDYCELIKFEASGHCVLKCSMKSAQGGVALLDLGRTDCE